MSIITKGRHPWNLISTGKGIVRECPKCNSRDIRGNHFKDMGNKEWEQVYICYECGYCDLDVDK
jgi:hypothetical protein